MATWRRVGAEFRVHILKQENFTMNNSRKLGVRRFCVLSLTIFFSRDIYLPAGSWRDYNTGQSHKGGEWLKNYSAPLDKLPLLCAMDRRSVSR